MPAGHRARVRRGPRRPGCRGHWKCWRRWRRRIGPRRRLCRRPAAAADAGGTPGPGEAGAAPAGLPGPLKVLAAVAAPDETKTENVPLDVEAEMQAVLDAVGGVAGSPVGQVRILEVASLA